MKSVTLRCRQNASSEEESNGREKITCPDTFSLSCSFKDITEQRGATCVPVAVKRWEIEDLKFNRVKICAVAETNYRIKPRILFQIRDDTSCVSVQVGQDKKVNLESPWGMDINASTSADGFQRLQENKRRRSSCRSELPLIFLAAGRIR